MSRSTKSVYLINSSNLEILSLFIIPLWKYLTLKFDDYIRLNIKITVVQNLKNHGCCFYLLKFKPKYEQAIPKT